MTLAAVGQPKPLWAYNSTPSVPDREYRLYLYDHYFAVGKRVLEPSLVIELLRHTWDDFSQNPTIKDDYKYRVQRAIWSFRRGLSDDGDVLSEFLTHWTSMEGLDCVFRKVLPSRQSTTMDGVREVFCQLGLPDAFDSLQNLRHGLAHGNFTLSNACQTAEQHIQSVRNAHITMIMSIVKMPERSRHKVISYTAFKKTFTPSMIFFGTINFEPGNVASLTGHPRVDIELKGLVVERKGDTLVQRPDWRFTSKNIPTLSMHGYEMWDEAGSSVQLLDMDTTIIPRAEECSAVTDVRHVALADISGALSVDTGSLWSSGIFNENAIAGIETKETVVTNRQCSSDDNQPTGGRELTEPGQQ